MKPACQSCWNKLVACTPKSEWLNTKSPHFPREIFLHWINKPTVLTKRTLDFQPSFLVPSYLCMPLLITTSFYCACPGQCDWQSRKNIIFWDTWVWYITTWILFLVFINTSHGRCIQGFPETCVSTSLRGMSHLKRNIKRTTMLDYLLLLVLLFIVISCASDGIFILWASLFRWHFVLFSLPSQDWFFYIFLILRTIAHCSDDF